jgi:hypothetical protein
MTLRDRLISIILFLLGEYSRHLRLIRQVQLLFSLLREAASFTVIDLSDQRKLV